MASIRNWGTGTGCTPEGVTGKKSIFDYGKHIFIEHVWDDLNAGDVLSIRLYRYEGGEWVKKDEWDEDIPSAGSWNQCVEIWDWAVGDYIAEYVRNGVAAIGSDFKITGIPTLYYFELGGSWDSGEGIIIDIKRNFNVGETVHVIHKWKALSGGEKLQIYWQKYEGEWITKDVGEITNPEGSGNRWHHSSRTSLFQTYGGGSWRCVSAINNTGAAYIEFTVIEVKKEAALSIMVSEFDPSGVHIQDFINEDATVASNSILDIWGMLFEPGVGKISNADVDFYINGIKVTTENTGSEGKDVYYRPGDLNIGNNTLKLEFKGSAEYNSVSRSINLNVVEVAGEGKGIINYIYVKDKTQNVDWDWSPIEGWSGTPEAKEGDECFLFATVLNDGDVSDILFGEFVSADVIPTEALIQERSVDVGLTSSDNFCWHFTMPANDVNITINAGHVI